MDGALYRVELRAAGESWDDASSLYVLGPVIQFSSDTPFMQYTGLPISWELPRASQAKGDMVRYSIVPALPEGLEYGQEAGEAYVDLAASEHPSITGAVGHTVGGSKQFYRLMGCDVEKGIVDTDSCDTHIFQIEITPATVKPLADVIRDREYADRRGAGHERVEPVPPGGSGRRRRQLRILPPGPGGLHGSGRARSGL